MAALLLVVVGFFLLGVDAADFSIGGLGLLAALIVALGLWVGGWFDRSTWFADEETSAQCAQIDRELEERGL